MVKSKKFKMFIIIVLTIFVGWLSIYSILPRTDKSNLETGFSAQNAFSHIKVIAKRPHPQGSKHHEHVREYILNQLKDMGLNPKIHESEFFTDDNTYGKVYNIVAKIEGTDSTGAVAVSAHYDTVSQSPGANDDTSGVCVILEGIRLLLEKGQPKNDVIILITDGEENSLLGMKAFMREHRYAKDIKFAINLEARGTSGPTLMFETTPKDLNTVRQFGKASDRIVSTSVMPALYNILPNYTDYNEYKERGIQGLNFAYIGKGYNYHKLGDNIDNMEMNTLQHMGDNFVPSLMHFANIDLNGLSSDNNGIYFNIFNLLFIIYPTWLAIPLLIIALILCTAGIWSGIKKRTIKLSQVSIGLGLELLIALLLFIGFPFLQQATRLISKELFVKLWSNYYNSIYLFAGMTLLTLFFTYLFNIPLVKRIGSINILCSNLVLWTLLSILTFLLLPEASYLFVWVAIALGVVFIIKVNSKKIREEKNSVNPLDFTPFLISLILLMPIVYLFTEAFNLKEFKLVVVFLVFIFGLFIPGIITLCKKNWITVVLIFLTSTSFFIAETVSSDVQILDGSDTIYSSDYIVAEYTGYKTGEDKRGKWKVYGYNNEFLQNLHNKNDVINVPYPEAEILSDSVTGGVRKLKLSIKPSSAAAACFLNIYNSDRRISKVILNDKYEAKREDYIHLELRAQKNVTMEIQCKPDNAIKFSISENTFGLDNIQSKDMQKVLDGYDEINYDKFLGVLVTYNNFEY